MPSNVEIIKEKMPDSRQEGELLQDDLFYCCVISAFPYVYVNEMAIDDVDELHYGESVETLAYHISVLVGNSLE